MHHLIFGRVKYSVYISLCDVHECKLFIAWLLTAIDLISFWRWQSNAGDTNKDWRAFQSTNARPIDELTTKTDAFFQDLWFSDKSKTVNTQIRVVVLVFRFSGETEKQVICPGGFPVVGFLLTPFFTPIQVGTSTTTSEYLCMGEIWWSLYNKNRGNQ